VLLLGFLPVDVHHFKLLAVDSMGIKESSQSLMNSVWSHERIISANGADAKVRDVVYYEGKVAWLGKLLQPLYRAIFVHRHKRLKSKYAGGR